ncbi:MAG: Hsp20/alpha crystallin family protein [Candidatus Nomurabacteria bacterium]|nr:Hsp20/alpha crystallin family protein [Candidatus Nomurabacteria bacterium]USN88240.1 MAG: Hsp20/alpha crystallin family protein [Candidatus Nomurabacteria bacterium]
MSLIKWEPFDEFDRLLRDVHPLTSARGNQVGFDMAVDVYEDGNDIVAEMNVPGLKAEDIDVEVEDNYLRIAGRREEMQEKKEKNHYAKEIRRGSFERVVQLPDSVEQEKVGAEYKDGVLKVIMPKREKTPDKKVKVQVK